MLLILLALSVLSVYAVPIHRLASYLQAQAQAQARVSTKEDVHADWKTFNPAANSDDLYNNKNLHDAIMYCISGKGWPTNWHDIRIDNGFRPDLPNAKFVGLPVRLENGGTTQSEKDLTKVYYDNRGGPAEMEITRESVSLVEKTDEWKVEVAMTNSISAKIGASLEIEGIGLNSEISQTLGVSESKGQTYRNSRQKTMTLSFKSTAPPGEEVCWIIEGTEFHSEYQLVAEVTMEGYVRVHYDPPTTVPAPEGDGSTHYYYYLDLGTCNNIPKWTMVTHLKTHAISNDFNARVVSDPASCRPKSAGGVASAAGFADDGVPVFEMEAVGEAEPAQEEPAQDESPQEEPEQSWGEDWPVDWENSWGEWPSSEEPSSEEQTNEE